MFKKIFFPSLVIVIIAAACNNTPGDTKAESKEQQLKDSIALYPDSLLMRENLIEYYRDNDNYQQALAETQKYLAKDSMSARMWDIQATLYFEAKDTAHSISSFENAVFIDPNPKYLMSLGSIYAEVKDPRALAVADAVMINSKGDARRESLFIKGLYYSFSGNNTKAIPYYDSCIAIDYTYMFAYREKAICLYNMGKYNDALDVLSKAIEIVNTYEEAYYWMGRCHEKLGNTAQAIQDYQTALQIDKDYVEAKEALANLGVN